MEHRDGKACMMKNGELFRVVQKNCWDLKERLKEMDETGYVLMGLFAYHIADTPTSYHISNFYN